jgi:hypothetical protein
MIGCQEMMLDLPLLGEICNEIVLEFQSIVCLDVTRRTIAVVDVSVEEVSDFCSSLLGKR